MKVFQNKKDTEFVKMEIDKNIKYELKKIKLRRKLESILNIRVVIALTYLKEYYLCKK